MIAVGIDIGGTSIKVAVMDDRREVWVGGSKTYARPDAGEVRAALADALDGSPLGSVVDPVPIGLCVPGILDVSGARVVRSANMPGLVGEDLQALLASAMPATLRRCGALCVCSDAHAAAADFARLHGLRGRLLGVSLGTGVGAAVLDDGELLRVSGGSSGHFGQLDVSVPGIDPIPVGPDGGRGGLEAYIGLPALRARHGDAAAWLASLVGAEPELHALARALRIAHAIYRPDHIALLGGLGIRLAAVAESIRALVADRLTSVARDGWTLRCGSSDHHAARGAAWLAERGLHINPTKDRT